VVPVGVEELVAAAAKGDQAAWTELVERYSGLVWGVARSYRLSTADASDVAQTVWLKLVEHLPALREPAAVPGWLATTTRHESLRTIRRSGRELPTDSSPMDERTVSNEPDPAAVVERAATRVEVGLALDRLSLRCRTLLRALATWPDASYAQVSAALDIPIGSIGPTRGRCLEHLRAALLALGAV
jgi:RNA polymerase sigma factor (sigma-70 family)